MCTLKEGHLRVFINLISFYYIPSGYTLHTSAQIHCVCCALWRQICFTGFDEAVIIMVFYGAVWRALLGSTCSSGLSRMRMYCKWLISRVCGWSILRAGFVGGLSELAQKQTLCTLLVFGGVDAEQIESDTSYTHGTHFSCKWLSCIIHHTQNTRTGLHHREANHFR